jgi:hypothetical protein
VVVAVVQKPGKRHRVGASASFVLRTGPVSLTKPNRAHVCAVDWSNLTDSAHIINACMHARLTGQISPDAAPLLEILGTVLDNRLETPLRISGFGIIRIPSR